MGKHSGEGSGSAGAVSLHRRRLAVLAAGITATLIAWGLLVWAAIDFGAEARNGAWQGWMFLGFATVGATACLFVTLILVSKLLATLRGEIPSPRVPGGGRRAAR